MTKLIEKKQQYRRDIMKIIWQAIDSVNPENAVGKYFKLKYENLHVGDRVIDLSNINDIYVIGAGKASPLMAKVSEDILMKRLTGGQICTKYGHGTPLHNLTIMEAGHPVPDKNSKLCAQRALNLANSCEENDLLICLLSGGASAIWTAPCPPITLDEKIQTTEVLLACGADIHEINTVRKHISNIKGGYLAQAAHPATVVTLAISDVVGDNFASIGSGPTVGDPSTFKEALDVINKYDLAEKLPRSVLDRILDGYGKQINETPKPSNEAFIKNTEVIIGSNIQALDAAQNTARYLGYRVNIYSSRLTGEAREIGPKMIEKAKKMSKSIRPGEKPIVLLSGGETTVTLQGNGKGGRNQEMALAAAIAMEGHDNMMFASIGTDGTDGPTDAAGAFADGTTVGAGKDSGMEAENYLKDNNSYEYFDNIQGLIRTGPTGTNVMDIQVLIIG
ncbi:MAG: glycerate kinase [candidate division Zixibacteria bacterium]|nr:glycerate kinase [candidate division Zixibacteria bacterium]